MKLVPINTIFHIEYGNQFDFNKLSPVDDGINFVSRSRNNLGVTAQVDKYNSVEPYESELITVTLGGTYLLSAFVQPEPFYTAQNVKVLKPQRPMSLEDKLFYCIAIGKNRFKYTSHGREANSTFDDLLVPDKIPEYWNNLSVKNSDHTNKDSLLRGDIRLKDFKWHEYSILGLFDIKGTTTTTITELQSFGEGPYPYVTTQATNNGVEGFYNFFTEEGGVLTVDSAVLGYCSYQPDNFSASDHVEKLIPKFGINKYSATFIATIINREQYRYNYGRKSSQKRLKTSKIQLPWKDDLTPDFELMEKYIKSLPYSSSL